MSKEYGVGIEPGIDVEISPHYDLWMRGATTGKVISMLDNGSICKLKMHNTKVKKLQKFLTVYVKRV